MNSKVALCAAGACVMFCLAQRAEGVSDADGNTYTTVTIGNQVWTVENWRSTKYNDGTAIPLVTDSAAWGDLSTPGCCFYNNSTAWAERTKWGVLYNWFAVQTGKLAPAGWRVPSDADWSELQAHLIATGHNWDGTTQDNKIAKALAAKTDWETYTDSGAIGNDLTENNGSGFSALPGGYRSFEGNFCRRTSFGYWWSSAESDASTALSFYLINANENLHRSSIDKRSGFSLRLVRNVH